MRLSIGSQCTDMNVVASLRDAKFCIRCSFTRSVVLHVIPGRTALTYSSIDVTRAHTKVEKQMRFAFAYTVLSNQTPRIYKDGASLTTVSPNFRWKDGKLWTVRFDENAMNM